MRLDKPYTSDQYAELAIYCNENNMTIVDRGEYLLAMKIESYKEGFRDGSLDNAIRKAEVSNMKRYLVDTQEYVIELFEASITDDNLFQCLKTRYAEVLKERARIRRELKQSN